MKRWLIRIACLLLLLFFAAQWVESYFYSHTIVHQGKSGHSFLISSWGTTIFGRFVSGGVVTPSLRGWFFETNRASSQDYSDFVVNSRHHFAGFSLTTNSEGFRCSVPLYLPTLLSALLVILIWRKNCRKTPRHAFPVEPESANTPSP